MNAADILVLHLLARRRLFFASLRTVCMHTVWTPKSWKISISPLYTIGKLLFKTEPLVVVVGDHGNVICITYMTGAAVTSTHTIVTFYGWVCMRIEGIPRLKKSWLMVCEPFPFKCFTSSTAASWALLSRCWSAAPDEWCACQLCGWEQEGVASEGLGRWGALPKCKEDLLSSWLWRWSCGRALRWPQP